MKTLLGAFLTLLLLLFTNGSAVSRTAGEMVDVIRFVNPFIGTDGYGNTFPGASLPFGMIQWSPDTTSNGFYKYGQSKIRGFSLTHLNGAGCPIFADVPILPTVGPIKNSPANNPSEYLQSFSHDNEKAEPGFYSVNFDSGVRAKLSVTPRTGIGVFTFPATDQANVLIDAGGSATGNSMSSVRVLGDDKVVGWAMSGTFCGSNTVYTLYFAVQFDRPFKRFGTWNVAAVNPELRSSTSKQPGVFVTFDTRTERSVSVKVGISYVSVANALMNLESENERWNFDAVRAKAHAAWSERLGQIEVEGGTDEQKTIFYTALYHSLLAPSVFSDANGEYMGFDRLVHTARGRHHYTNISDWDTYRSQVQLQALLAPREANDLVRSLIDDAEQSGWLPKWPLANDVTASMGGDNPVPLITTAYAFGAKDFDTRKALAFMLKGATEPGVGIHGYRERPGLAEYLKRGYIPYEPSGCDGAGDNAASVTLEYATDDFCIAQFARSLGDARTHASFMRRAQNWQNLFDAESGFIRPRRPNGVFLEGFDPDAVLPKSEIPWERLNQAGFQEGGTWQYTWMVRFNYEGLFASIGGTAEVSRRLDKFFTKLIGWGHPYFNIANEPSFASPYAYTFAGDPSRTQATVRRIMAETFNATPGGLPGNDDLGATSAWYVWGALGLYPAIPGVGGFVVGSPKFSSIKIRLGDGRRLVIRTDGDPADKFFVGALSINGRPYESSWLPIELLRPGTTTLDLVLAENPGSAWAARPADLPPSFTEGQAPAIAFIHGDDSIQAWTEKSGRFSFGIRKVISGPLRLEWYANPPKGIALQPATGTLNLSGQESPPVNVQVILSPAMKTGSYVVPIRFRVLSAGRSKAAWMPETVLGIRVGE
jgi:predicted alpha-1,2-mannosidase